VRQLSQDMEAEHRREVADLERELAATDDLQCQLFQLSLSDHNFSLFYHLTFQPSLSRPLLN
jgi:hypothetical protein